MGFRPSVHEGHLLYEENPTLDVGFGKAYSGEDDMKTPFDILLRSANCNKISKGGHSE